MSTERPKRLSNGAKLALALWLSAAFLIVAVLFGYAYWSKTREKPTVCEESPVAEKKVYLFGPADTETAAPVDQPIRAEVLSDDDLIDPKTVSSANVALFRVADRSVVPTKVSVVEDGHAIELSPLAPLESQTNYAFAISSGVKDKYGNALPAVQTAFVTASAEKPALPSFEQVALPATKGLGVTCVAVGPDGRLWMSVDDGRIMRFDIAADGTLSNKREIKTLVDAAGGKPRLIGGFAFDPSAKPEEPVLWVTHTSFGFINMGDWRGSVSRLSGPDLNKAETVIVNLPRSARDHVIHQPVFGPDGCLYFHSGSMSSYGDADGYWGWRKEHAFSACVAKLDLKKLSEPNRWPIDVKTPEDGGTYLRESPDAPLTVYASGIRVAYDLCWHSSGKLFAAVNGSSPGGNTPATKGVPQVWTVTDVEHDWLFDIKPGSYYGHPNPMQGHFVLNGGNPTAGADFAEVTQYPVGTQPDAKWQPAAFDFGAHVSPNGTIEYRGNDALDKTLVVCRYNVGNDLLAIRVDAAGNIAGVIPHVAGWENLQNPLDVCQDQKTGNLYVSEYGKHAVTLLRKK
ncbi:MAG: Ig-like domain-containing protein [Tepidisphaeraceae bacterium]